MEANSQIMMQQEKINQLQEREAQLKGKVGTMEEGTDERDQVILEMKKRLECEQTDEVIFEAKIKQLKFDLEQARAQGQSLLEANKSLSVENEQLKNKEREQALKIDLVSNQL